MTHPPGSRAGIDHGLVRGFAACLAVLVFTWAGCAKRVSRPVLPPPPIPAPAPSPLPGARPAPGYDRRVEPLRGIDTSPLRGHRIVLDPGHGGRFPGALGLGGLTE